MAVAFLLGADCLQYGKLVENMENDYLQGRNNYPTTLSAAYHLLINWKQDPRLLGLHKAGPISHDVSFNTTDGGDSLLLNNGERGKQKGKANVTSNECRKKGHHANECNEEKLPPATPITPSAEPLIENQTATTLLLNGVSNDKFNSNLPFQFFNQAIENLNDEVTMQIGSDGRLPKSWILLDNQTTVDVFYNKELLSNIRKDHKKLTSTVMQGLPLSHSLMIYLDMEWYDDGTTPMESQIFYPWPVWRDMGTESHRSSEGNAFHVYKSDGTVLVFLRNQTKTSTTWIQKRMETMITLMWHCWIW